MLTGSLRFLEETDRSGRKIALIYHKRLKCNSPENQVSAVYRADAVMLLSGTIYLT